MKVLTRWVLRSLLCAIAFSVLHGDVLACEACTFAGVIVRGNGQTGGLTVQQGTTVTLTASAKQPGSTCSGGLYCDWSVNGVPIGSSVGSPAYQYHTFNTLGTSQVSADCECMPCDIRITEYLTVNVTTTPPPGCGTNATLQTITAATLPSNRTRTKLGVGERTTLSLTPAPNCAVTWSLSGMGQISAQSGSSITFDAHDVASSPTVTSIVNGIQRAVTYNVVEPDSIIMTQNEGSGILHTYGYASVGFLGRAYITPEDVSFDGIEVREGFAFGEGTGFYQQFTGQMHPDGGWEPVNQGMSIHPSKDSACDEIFTGDYGPPFLSGGTFRWDIPWFFRVPTVSQPEIGREFATIPQYWDTDEFGNTCITKGVSDPTDVTRCSARFDPTSAWGLCQ